jgi:Zn-finger nucleic acid-binding protein
MRVDNASGALTCNHCGSVEQVPALVRYLERAGESSTSCPTCTSPLAECRLEGHPLLFCDRCHGMLVAMELFVSIVEAAREHDDRTDVISPRRQSPGSRVLTCPECRQPMVNHLYGGPGNLVIDACERCHVNWLDGGELRRIARAPRGRG